MRKYLDDFVQRLHFAERCPQSPEAHMRRSKVQALTAMPGVGMLIRAKELQKAVGIHIRTIERNRSSHQNFRSCLAFEALVEDGVVPSDCAAVVFFIDDLIQRQKKIILGIKKERAALRRGHPMRRAYDISLFQGLENVATSQKILLRLCDDLKVLDFCEGLAAYQAMSTVKDLPAPIAVVFEHRAAA